MEGLDTETGGSTASAEGAPSPGSAGSEGIQAALDALDGALVAAGVAPDAADDLRVAVHAAIAGGRAACVFYGGALEISDKGTNDPVTAADHASNGAILEVLADARPADPVLSEEAPRPDEATEAPRLWVVDPLDGTKEFIAENGEFSVMVGLAQGGAATLGAVYQPAIGRVFVGIVDVGAWALAEQGPDAWSASPLEVDENGGGEGTIGFVRSRSHMDDRLVQLATELGDIREVISGSVGIKCALVARGEADLYVHPVPYLKEWDTCAPEAVLRGAGGWVTDCAGQPLEYGAEEPRQLGGIFAATPAAWERAKPLVAEITRPLFEDRED